jgi:2-dehydro-3-deoxyglucarate aldolase/4-hydroxy-2-oxoheptanedioate aldolase
MGNYWLKDYQYETWKTDFEEHFIVIPQIESQRGVDNAAELAAHPLVTALGLGPYDLSADLGCCWDPQDDRYIGALERVKSAADQAGKKVWAGTDVAKFQSQGYTFLWIGTTTSVLTAAIMETLNELHGSSASPDISGAAPPPA